MNLNTALYLTNIIHHFYCMLILMFLIGLIVLLVAFVGKIFCFHEYTDVDGEAEKMWTAILKKGWIVLIIAITGIFIPGDRTMYLMLGVSYLQDSNLPTKVSKALELKLDNYIKELSTQDNHD